MVVVQEDKVDVKAPGPGFEPGSQARQACMLAGLHHPGTRIVFAEERLKAMRILGTVRRQDLASVVRELFPSGGVLAFGSFGHGHGRSTLANETLRILKDADIPAYRISTGEVFRRIA